MKCKFFLVLTFCLLAFFCCKEKNAGVHQGAPPIEESKAPPIEAVSESTNLGTFAGGCLGDGCGVCDGVAFKPDHTFQAVLGCHYASGVGRWTIKENAIIVDATYTPSAEGKISPVDDSLESFNKAAAEYSEKNKHTVTLRFSQNAKGEFAYEIVNASNPERAKADAPRGKLGSMRSYTVSQ